MRYTPDYQLKLKDGREIPLLFHTSMYRKYCEYKRIQLKDLFQRIQNTVPSEEDNKGELFTALDLADILLLAHQCYCRGNRIECTADEFEAEDWIEQLGGFIGAIEVNTKIFTLFVSKLARVDENAVVTEEKKMTAA